MSAAKRSGKTAQVCVNTIEQNFRLNATKEMAEKMRQTGYNTWHRTERKVAQILR